MKGLKKFKKTIIKHKKIILGTGIFAIVGLIALLIGFEITNDWHAIRNWLASDNATTFFTHFESNAASMIFCAPLILVLIASAGLYSQAGTCFIAAA